MNCELSQIVSVVSEMVTRTRGLPPSTVQPSTRLLQDGLLDSFGLVVLVEELETTLGAKIPQGMLLPEDFETPEVLFERLKQL
jgi:acyl carrier protein